MTTIRTISLYLALAVIFGACKTDNRQITSDMIHFPPSGGGQTDNAPVITFDSTICNFGTLAIGEKFPHTFRFTNTGKSPLIITQVNPSCGCTTAKDWSQQPIAPGETGQISVEFSSTGNSGVVDKTISVLTNCVPAVEVLRIQGTVVGVDNLPKVKSPVEMEMETP
jgi:hypothetical protein